VSKLRRQSIGSDFVDARAESVAEEVGTECFYRRFILAVDRWRKPPLFDAGASYRIQPLSKSNTWSKVHYRVLRVGLKRAWSRTPLLSAFGKSSAGSAPAKCLLVRDIGVLACYTRGCVIAVRGR